MQDFSATQDERERNGFFVVLQHTEHAVVIVQARAEEGSTNPEL